ncbi:adenylate/guanylate cyclase domain-containing protein (plasmid) [Sinorhizobium numidicum]|uniref:Adenylate/guanylate cyclase domain-containing protein n=1 Tax=Sinorhizobium numidicum TaxID=680248 RepID=A0ABY8D414_9HYPH|nr:adenylate/guanylate cyclase domain-containing protein [Sinorhizobium numidicum]WEX79439.1 adenylate/guanylate cyclase domain-containing protein [Sinorhizobium numidicum]WEX85605.1 adenylate/guanylate cyclase domain-containing protein [Sinorhizobium numidicum]
MTLLRESCNEPQRNLGRRTQRAGLIVSGATVETAAHQQVTKQKCERSAYQLRRRFVLLVLPSLAAALIGLLFAFAQALSSSAEYAYESQAAAWHSALVATAERADPAAWLARQLGATKGEVAVASSALSREAEEMNWLCAVILDASGSIIAGTADRGCRNLSLGEFKSVKHGFSLFREQDGPSMHWLVATKIQANSKEPPLVVVTAEASANWERALSTYTLLWLGGVGSVFAISIGLALLFVSKAQSEIDHRTAALNEAHASLARFVSKNVSRRAEARSSSPRRINASVLFLDIRDFSSFAEAATPYEAAALVSAVANIGFQAVTAHGGDVDRLLGDGLVAWFEGDERKENAWRAANETLTRLRQCELPRQVGIGIHEGNLVEAEIGAGGRKDATILGDTVNIAAGLCGGALPSELIVSFELGRPPEGLSLVETATVALEIKGHQRPVQARRLRLGSGVECERETPTCLHHVPLSLSGSAAPRPPAIN